MSKMIAFESIKDYIDYWVHANKVELRDVKVHAGRAYASPAFSNHLVLGGIGFRLFVNDRPCAERQLINLCVADSNTDGYAASANQIKTGVTRWLFDKSAELVQDKEIDDVFDWRDPFVKANQE